VISHASSAFWKAYATLPNTIQHIAKRQYRRFVSDPYHASLHFKRIHSAKPIYSARVNKDYRALGVLNENTVIWFWIGSHADYEALIKRL